ncbi:MAG: ArsR family transcriptional regulator [Thermoleophilia bacterium]
MLISVYPDNMVFMKQASQSFKALADETRLGNLALLTEGELCLCDMVAVLELPQSTV